MQRFSKSWLDFFSRSFLNFITNVINRVEMRHTANPITDIIRSSVDFSFDRPEGGGPGGGMIDVIMLIFILFFCVLLFKVRVSKIFLSLVWYCSSNMGYSKI